MKLLLLILLHMGQMETRMSEIKSCEYFQGSTRTSLEKGDNSYWMRSLEVYPHFIEEEQGFTCMAILSISSNYCIPRNQVTFGHPIKSSTTLIQMTALSIHEKVLVQLTSKAKIYLHCFCYQLAKICIKTTLTITCICKCIYQRNCCIHAKVMTIQKWWPS